jgi:hypothetical protein
MDLTVSVSGNECHKPGIPYSQELDRGMVDLQAFAGIPGAVEGLPVSVIIPAIILGYLAGIIVYRLTRDKNCSMSEPMTKKRTRK